MPRARLHATNADRQRAYRLQKRLTALAPDIVCKTFGPCTVYRSDWQAIYPLLPRHAAVVTDPPYDAGYDVTQARRRPSQWTRNFEGYDQAFDPTPWLTFPEVILFGADHYRERLPAGGSWCFWDKTPGRQPADFAPGELIWRSKAGPLQKFVHLWCGGMRAGEENHSRLPRKLHPAQKPIALLLFLVQQITAPVVIDPFMGSGTTLAACIRLGRPCIGIEMNPTYFETACARMQKELQQLPLFPHPTAEENP